MVLYVSVQCKKDEVMKGFNSITFRRLYGGPAPQRRCYPTFGIDNGDYGFPPVFYGNTTVFGKISSILDKINKNFRYQCHRIVIGQKKYLFFISWGKYFSCKRVSVQV